MTLTLTPAPTPNLTITLRLTLTPTRALTRGVYENGGRIGVALGSKRPAPDTGSRATPGRWKGSDKGVGPSGNYPTPKGL